MPENTETGETESRAPIATVGDLRAALADLGDDLIVMVDGHLYVGPGSTYGREEEGWKCDECRATITTDGFISEEHADWCSGHPANEATASPAPTAQGG